MYIFLSSVRPSSPAERTVTPRCCTLHLLSFCTWLDNNQLVKGSSDSAVQIEGKW